ncbi:MAG: ribonuclease HII [Verrucomicrobiota bacterium]
MQPEGTISWIHEEDVLLKGFRLIAGVDEVGRGPLAGPVIAAAAILPMGYYHPLLKDSKKLTPKRRMDVAAELCSDTRIIWAIGEATVEEIDTHNILQATFIAMRKAVQALIEKPDFVLVDGNQNPKLGLPLKTIVGGDGISPSIAAASIIAKQHRDNLMDRLAEEYPGYGMEKHKGYGTAFHLEALQRLGPTPIHRMSFEPVRLSRRS